MRVKSTVVSNERRSGRQSATEVNRLDYSRATAPQIFEVVKNAILKMELAPGCLISEADIAAQFGASRTPVREAFLRLREAGLVTTRPSRGNYVTTLNKDRIREAQFIREAIEVAVMVKICTSGLSRQTIQDLTDNLDEQAEAAASVEDIRFQRLDDRFHATFVHASGFSHVAELLEREKLPLNRLRVLALRDKSHLLDLLDEHRRILDAAARGDTEQATAAMREHLRSVLNVLSTVSQRNADYFQNDERPA